MVNRFIITNARIGTRYTGVDTDKSTQWTMYVEKVTKAGLFNTYPEAEAKIATLDKGYYQIDKIFKV